MSDHENEWKPMFSYAAMSNGRAERMLGMIKKSVGRLVVGSERGWEEELSRAIYGYRRRPLDIEASPYELMYGVPPRVVQSDQTVGHDTPIGRRMLENVAILAVRAERFLASE